MRKPLPFDLKSQYTPKAYYIVYKTNNKLLLTYTQTDTVITILRLPTEGEVTTVSSSLPARQLQMKN